MNAHKKRGERLHRKAAALARGDADQFFRCGTKVALIPRACWPRGLKYIEVRPVKRRRRPHIFDDHVVVYDHEGADTIDAYALLAVAQARFFTRRSTGHAIVTHMRIWIEYVCPGVRPRLDSLRDADLEVADLLRRRITLDQMKGTA